jgi:hypothetical protein
MGTGKAEPSDPLLLNVEMSEDTTIFAWADYIPPFLEY